MARPFVQTACCFDLGSLTAEDVASLIERGLGFLPQEVRAPFYKGRFSPRFLRKLRESGDPDRLSITASTALKRPSFQVFSLGVWAMQVITWETTSQYPEDEFLDSLTSYRGFNAAYVCDSDDVFWQSETEISNYELFGRPHIGLKKRFDATFGRPVIDVRENPGRRSLFPHIYLQAAAKMWFSGVAFDYLSEAQLLRLSCAGRIARLRSGAVFVELFSDPLSAAFPENRARQRTFRRLLGLDDLESRSTAIAIDDSDPAFEIETVQSAAGPARLITHYLDFGGGLTRKSKAVASERLVVHSDGRVEPLPEESG